MPDTSYHNWTMPTVDGSVDQWGQILNDMFDDEMDADVERRGTLANRPAAADVPDGAKYLVDSGDDVGAIYIESGDSWRFFGRLPREAFELGGTWHIAPQTSVDVGSEIETQLSNGYTSFVIHDPADGSAHTWTPDVVVDTDTTPEFELQVKQGVEIEYQGSGWPLTLGQISTSVTDEYRPTVAGGRWTVSAGASPSGWIRIRDTYGCKIAAESVLYEEQGTGVSIENHDAFSEKTRVEINRCETDKGVEFLTASETGGAGTSSFHGTRIIDSEFRCSTFCIRTDGNLRGWYLLGNTFRPAADNMSLLIFDHDFGRDGVFLGNKFEDVGDNFTSTTAIETLGGLFYGPLILNQTFGIGIDTAWVGGDNNVQISAEGLKGLKVENPTGPDPIEWIFDTGTGAFRIDRTGQGVSVQQTVSDAGDLDISGGVRADGFYTVDGTTVSAIADAVSNYQFVRLRPGVTYTHDGSSTITHGAGDGHQVVDARSAIIEVRGTGVVKTVKDTFEDDSITWIGGTFIGSQSTGETAFLVEDNSFGKFHPRHIFHCDVGFVMRNNESWCEFCDVSFRGRDNRITLARLGIDSTGVRSIGSVSGGGTQSFRDTTLEVTGTPRGESGSPTAVVWDDEAKVYASHQNIECNLNDDVVGWRMHRNYPGTFTHFHSETPGTRQNGTALQKDKVKRSPWIWANITTAGGSTKVAGSSSKPMHFFEKERSGADGARFGYRVEIDGEESEVWNNANNSGYTKTWGSSVHHRMKNLGGSNDPVLYWDDGNIGGQAGFYIDDSVTPAEVMVVDAGGNVSTVS